MHKNSIKLSFVFLDIILFIILCTTVIYGEIQIMSFDNKTLIYKDKDIYSFVEIVYKDYSKKNFKAVYEKLHPVIKKELPEETYVNFQEGNFNKYQLEISNVVVSNFKTLEEIPQNFEKYDLQGEKGLIIEVEVSYHISFKYGGLIKEKDLQKKVYVLYEGINFYLLWDLSVIK